MRENVSYVFFQRADRAGSARRARRCGHAARHGRRRSQICAAWRAGVPRDSTAPRRAACGWRRTPAARSRAPTASTPSGARAPRRRALPADMSASGQALAPAAQGRRRRVRKLGPDEAALWARVAATIRPLNRRQRTPVEARQAASADPPALVPAVHSQPSPGPRRAARQRSATTSTAAGNGACDAARSSPTGRSTSTASTSTRRGRDRPRCSSAPGSRASGWSCSSPGASGPMPSASAGGGFAPRCATGWRPRASAAYRRRPRRAPAPRRGGSLYIILRRR